VPADRAIRLGTNSPVNHVGMTVALEDLPPLLWHAELGRSLPDLWSGDRHRGVQLHDARDAVTLWANRYGQHAWLRQLEPPVTRSMEDGLLRTVARLDGTPSGRNPVGAGRRGPVVETSDAGPDRLLPGDRPYQRCLLPADRRPNSYDPGSFWSGDDLPLTGHARLGLEIAVTVPEQ
jgi:hypothetical protein